MWNYDLISETYIRMRLQLTQQSCIQGGSTSKSNPWPLFLLYIPFLTERVTLQSICCWQIVFASHPLIYLKPGEASPHNKWLHWKTSCQNSFATVKQIARQQKKLQEKLPRVSLGLFYFAFSLLCTERSWRVVARNQNILTHLYTLW